MAHGTDIAPFSYPVDYETFFAQDWRTADATSADAARRAARRAVDRAD
jgi:hypothetical protein